MEKHTTEEIAFSKKIDKEGKPIVATIDSSNLKLKEDNSTNERKLEVTDKSNQMSELPQYA